MTIRLTKLPGPPNSTEIKSLADVGPAHLELLDKPIYVTVATLRASGPPHLTVIWADRDDTHVYINSAKGRIKDRNLRARPEISIMAINPENPYHWISIEGKVVEIVDEEDPKRAEEVTKHIDDLAWAYVQKRPYPTRQPGEIRVKYKVEPSRIVAFGPLG
jgi:PPOX class probable F420-dependent enzyme